VVLVTKDEVYYFRDGAGVIGSSVNVEHWHGFGQFPSSETVRLDIILIYETPGCPRVDQLCETGGVVKSNPKHCKVLKLMESVVFRDRAIYHFLHHNKKNTD